MINLAIVADSHGSGLEKTIRDNFSDIKPFVLYYPGAKVERIKRMTISNQGRLRRFRPDILIIHVGHNNVAYHTSKNPHPDWAKNIGYEMSYLVNLAQNLLPSTKIYVSCPFPRIPAKNFSSPRCDSYNKLVRRYNRFLKAEQLNIISLYVRGLWISPKILKGKIEMFSEKDGLHLSDLGKKTVAEEWIARIKADV